MASHKIQAKITLSEFSSRRVTVSDIAPRAVRSNSFMTKTSKLGTGELTRERSPIVVVMGHVDHGKTTLLDYIKKTTVAIKEAGGITQSVGAYEVIHDDKRITFIDTPGHEAFTKMRARGATVADLAILVVAADDGVKPQTKEVIDVLRTTETPFIVAINKIDKNNADIELVKNELSQNGVLLEGYGGKVSWHGISAKTGEGVGDLLDLILLSAKTGEGVSDLLDLILLAAEVEGLTYDPASRAKGIIIEAKREGRRGITVTAIVKEGVLRNGFYIATPTAVGKIKALEDFRGGRVNELVPSSPALIFGFEIFPEVGEEFTADTVNIEEVYVKRGDQKTYAAANGSKDAVLLNVIVKADVSGSLEAISEILKTTENVRIVGQAVGDITDGDVKSAAATGALLVGFKVRPVKAAQNIARAQEVDIITSDIIYELLKTVEEKIEAKKSPPPEGELEVLATFSAKGNKQLVGGRVVAGRIRNKSELAIVRGGGIAGRGRVLNLQQSKKDAPVVNVPDECGIMFDSDVSVAVGDRLIAPPAKD